MSATFIHWIIFQSWKIHEKYEILLSMALENKLIFTDKFKILKNLKYLENCGYKKPPKQTNKQ